MRAAVDAYDQLREVASRVALVGHPAEPLPDGLRLVLGGDGSEALSIVDARTPLVACWSLWPPNRAQASKTRGQKLFRGSRGTIGLGHRRWRTTAVRSGRCDNIIHLSCQKMRMLLLCDSKVLQDFVE